MRGACRRISQYSGNGEPVDVVRGRQRQRKFFHEPPLSRPSATRSSPGGERAGRGLPIWFIAPIHVRILEVSATHAPYPLNLSFSPTGGEGAGTAVEGVSDRFMVPMRLFWAGRPGVNPAPLSVIVPNYNHGEYLPRCLEALLNQSLQPSEIIVIDDASTDNSMK